jgi:hypothetical protein
MNLRFCSFPLSPTFPADDDLHLQVAYALIITRHHKNALINVGARAVLVDTRRAS